jgi:ParB-like chromosome segregation protein Spo0J
MRPRSNRPGQVQTLLKHVAVEHRPISSLKPNDRNPRTHPKRQIRQIAESIRSFGFTNPVLIDDADTIIAGHGRVEAARLLGFVEVPTLRLKHLSAAERHAYAIADNRLAELAGWDRDLLRVELAYIAELDIDFDLTLTGFETSGSISWPSRLTSTAAMTNSMTARRLTPAGRR